MAVRTTADGRRRSLAWVYYSIITTLLVIGGFVAPVLFLCAVPAGLYAYYLFRGGRFVLWIW